MAGYAKTRLSRESVRQLAKGRRAGRTIRSLAEQFDMTPSNMNSVLQGLADRLDPEDDPVAVDRAVMGDWDSYEPLTFFERQTVAEILTRILEPMYPEEREQRIINFSEAWRCTPEVVYLRLGMWARGNSKAA